MTPSSVTVKKHCWPNEIDISLILGHLQPTFAAQSVSTAISVEYNDNWKTIFLVRGVRSIIFLSKLINLICWKS